MIDDLASSVKDEIRGFILGTVAQMFVNEMTITFGRFLDLGFPILQSLQPYL